MDQAKYLGATCRAVVLALALHASRAGAAPAWYDAKPLLAAVCPAVLAELHAQHRDTALEDLPLYDLDLLVRPSNGSFELTETLYFTNQGADPLPNLLLRIDANSGRTEASSLVRLLDGNCLEQPCTVRRISPGSWSIVFARPLRARERTRVVLHLRGAAEQVASARTTLLGQGLEGLSAFGRPAPNASYGLFATGDDILSLANFYALLAPRAAGHWQTLDSSSLGDLGSDELANVRASVSVPADSVVAHVGVVTGTTTTLNADGPGQHRKQLQIVAGLVRDFTLVAARGFEVATRSVSGVEVSSYFRGTERPAGEQVLDVAAFALRDFERRFGSYPYTRLGLAEAPLVGGAGGVEFSGLATIGSAFYKGADPSALGGVAGVLGALGQSLPSGGDMASAMREFVTAHEVAHQWWHVLVGSDSRNHPFADEGLAQYSTLLYFESRYGTERAAREAEQNLKLPYQMMRVAGQADAAAERAVASFASPVAYAGLVYGKGPLFYCEARKMLGDEAFFSRLRQYRNAFAFRSAPGRAVIESLAGAQRGAVEALARHWLDEAHGDTDLGKFSLSGLLQGFTPGAANPAAGELPEPLRQLLNGEGI